MINIIIIINNTASQAWRVIGCKQINIDCIIIIIIVLYIITIINNIISLWFSVIIIYCT